MCNDALGTYIHIPFCPYKCYFCDFVTIASTDELQAYYSSILTCEIKERLAKFAQKPRVSSIFYGGGTPGILALEHLQTIHQALLLGIELMPINETTLETTPEVISVERAQAWLALGINRLSIGIQSFQDEELSIVGRGHTAAIAIQSIKNAASAGFQNINCDLIYGLPNQDLTSWKKSLEKFLQMAQEIPEVKHISAYALELSPSAPLSKMFTAKSNVYATEQEYEQQHQYLINSLTQSGFYQYEISNFAKPGYQSIHNLNYWQEGEYLAFGASAHRYLRPYRSSNKRSIQEYLQDYLADETCELIDRKTMLKEAIMLGLRMTEGIDIAQFQKKHNLNLLETHGQLIDRLIDHGMLVLDNHRLKLTIKGQPIANLIISEFI